MPVQQRGIDTEWMPDLESVEIGFQRMTEEDRRRRDQVGQKVRLYIGEREGCRGKLFSRDAGPPAKTDL